MSTPPTSSPPAPAARTAMTASERRSTGWLAGIYALRMLGLFLVLPVFVLEARRYPGGDDPALVGLALGAYGLTQALFQLPFGLASDRLGRKRVILAGLLLFAVGSLVAALADSVWGLLAGRCLQGAGAVSAAVTALLADQTRVEVRTKAMAVVGASIGLVFALSLVLAPALTGRVGLAGLFWLTVLLALAGAAVIVWGVPPEPAVHAAGPSGGLRLALADANLRRLYLGVFVLHAVQVAMWVGVPALLVQAGLPSPRHWWVYLPAVLGSFLVMGGTLFPLERRGHLRAVLLVAVAAIALAQALLGMAAAAAWGAPLLGLALFVFFCGFNILEASQPSLVSRLAPASGRGAALGVYSTLQSLGLFAGGALGGVIAKLAGIPGLFAATSALALLWLALSWRLQTRPAAGA